MNVTVEPAGADDVPILTAMRNAAADDLTRRHGTGHWSSQVSERAVLRAVEAPPHTSRVLIARVGAEAVGSLRLVTKKPWAIDRRYFTPVRRPLYLIDMAVTPTRQRQGVGRILLDAARATTRAWPADAIALDAYAHPAAGAGPFYDRCGFREVGRVSYRGNPLIYYEWLA